jgi:hypothetical protein
MSMSRAWLATNFFNRTFSASSSLSRLASLAFMPPYWASQRCHVDSAISRCRHTISLLSALKGCELHQMNALAPVDESPRSPRTQSVSDQLKPTYRAFGMRTWSSMSCRTVPRRPVTELAIEHHPSPSRIVSNTSLGRIGLWRGGAASTQVDRSERYARAVHAPRLNPKMKTLSPGSQVSIKYVSGSVIAFDR